jgi:hypothetical protein
VRRELPPANRVGGGRRPRGWRNSIYLYDHPACDKEVGGGEGRPEEGSHHEMKNDAEFKIWNRFESKSHNGIKSCFGNLCESNWIIKCICICVCACAYVF